MFNFIEKLRQKPDKTKKKVAFLSALFLCGIIFVVWLSVIFPGFREDQAKKQAVQKLEPSPLVTFKATFEAGLSTMKDQYTELRNSIAEVATSSLGIVTATSTLVSATTTEPTD